MTNNTADKPWDVLQTQSALDHSYVKVAVEKDNIPDGQVVPEWPKIYTNDYVNAVVFNENNEAMVMEAYKHETGWASWQLPGDYLQEGENPISTIQQTLATETGYHTNHWIYLGSYVVDPNRHVGVGHFFCALGAKVAQSANQLTKNVDIKWMPLSELRYALLDGRIASLSHAIAVSLSLLTVMQQTSD